MVAEIVTVLMTATLLLVIVAMVRQRGGAAQVNRQRMGVASDPWSSAAPAPPSPPAVAPPPAPPPDADATGRLVMEHLRRLEERSAPGLAAQVMPVFLKDAAIRIESLRQAVQQHDGNTAHRLAHTLHGSAATVGAAPMVHACAEIIREVRLGAFDGCDRQLDQLDQDFESIRRAAEPLR